VIFFLCELFSLINQFGLFLLSSFASFSNLQDSFSLFLSLFFCILSLKLFIPSFLFFNPSSSLLLGSFFCFFYSFHLFEFMSFIVFLSLLLFSLLFLSSPLKSLLILLLFLSPFFLYFDLKESLLFFESTPFLFDKFRVYTFSFGFDN